MAKFIVKIELHDVDETSPDYDKLHLAMEEKGFSRKIKNRKGVWYHLPRALYIIKSKSTIKEIFKLAKNTAISVSTNLSLIASQTDTDIIFFGLKEVEDEP